jgi:glutaminyl-peptide cyclotransferase
MKRSRRLLHATASLALATSAMLPCACRRESANTPTGPVSKPASGAWTNFSGARAFEDVKAIVAIGPRPSGSERSETTRQFLEKRLREAGWETQRQTFTDTAPVRGPLKFTNLRARFPSSGTDPWLRPTPILAASHYDTKWVTDFLFLGANDSGSSCGLLLEAARALAATPTLATQCELVFLDGEEALVDFTLPRSFSDMSYDGLFGSRHYASGLRSLSGEQKPRWFVLFDMIGDQQLEVEFPRNSSPNLVSMALEAAASLGFSRQFSRGSDDMVDDHVPFQWAGLEVIDFIDFNSYRRAGYWHTAADTIDKLSPDSIEITGRTGLLLIEKLSSLPAP